MGEGRGERRKVGTWTKHIQTRTQPLYYNHAMDMDMDMDIPDSGLKTLWQLLSCLATSALKTAQSMSGCGKRQLKMAQRRADICSLPRADCAKRRSGEGSVREGERRGEEGRGGGEVS